MDAWVLRQQLAVLMSSMYEEGLLDEHFNDVRCLDLEGTPNFITRYVTMFTDNVERMLRELRSLQNAARFDFDKIEACVRDLYGYCSSIGAQSLRVACNNILQICDENDREGCKEAYRTLQSDYLYLQGKLEKMVQLEQSIYLHEHNKGQK